MSGSPDRDAVRRSGRAARHAIVGAERVAREQSLVGHLGSLQALALRTIGVFVAHDGEPDLTPLVQKLWQRGQDIALPALEDDPADHTMHFRKWSSDVELESGRYGIAVPPLAESSVVRPDCVLVSLAAFDAMGNRMGRGGGFFDRYLAGAHCQIVGVGFEPQRVARVPTEKHDVIMPILVTDLGVRFLS